MSTDIWNINRINQNCAQCMKREYDGFSIYLNEQQNILK